MAIFGAQRGKDARYRSKVVTGKQYSVEIDPNESTIQFATDVRFGFYNTAAYALFDGITFMSLSTITYAKIIMNRGETTPASLLEVINCVFRQRGAYSVQFAFAILQ